jgi:hypothetical protein
MAVTRSCRAEARRGTRSTTVAAAREPSVIPANNPVSTPSDTTLSLPPISQMAKNKLASTSTKRMTTRSMTRPNALRVVWSKGGQRDESLLNNRPVNASVLRRVAKEKYPTSGNTKSAKVVTKGMQKATRSTSKTARHPGPKFNKISRRQKNNSIPSTKRRQSTRLAQQSIEVNIDVPATLQDATSNSTADRSSTALASPTDVVPTSTSLIPHPAIRRDPTNGPSSFTESTVAQHEDMNGSPAREQTMQQYTSSTRAHPPTSTF